MESTNVHIIAAATGIIAALFIVPARGDPNVQLLEAAHDQVKATIDAKLGGCPTSGKKFKVFCSYAENNGMFQGIFCHSDPVTVDKKVTKQELVQAMKTKVVALNPTKYVLTVLEFIESILSAVVMKQLCPANPGRTLKGNTYEKDFASSAEMAMDVKIGLSETTEAIHLKKEKTYDEINLDNLLFPTLPSEPTKSGSGKGKDNIKH